MPEESTYQYRIFCPVQGELNRLPLEELAEADADAGFWAYEHRHHSCAGKGHTIERRYIGPWINIDQPVREVRTWVSRG